MSAVRMRFSVTCSLSCRCREMVAPHVVHDTLSGALDGVLRVTKVGRLKRSQVARPVRIEPLCESLRGNGTPTTPRSS
ncbi:hypothetical protein IG631_10747 [Alternaria alternata]|nr:hypothetical protein IG631_10747 [Alternaria alternata]